MTLYNWANSLAFDTDHLAVPTSIEQLQELVAGAERIHALGTGHSFSRVADTTGTLVSTAQLDVPIDIDAQAHTVTVGAGTRYGELAVALDHKGWALHNLGSLPHISVAGACATGTHGSGVGNTCLAAAVVAIEFVQADGKLVRVRRGHPHFGGSVLALGALGIATRLTLEIEPSYEVRQDLWLDVPVDAVAEQFDDVMGAGYSVSLFSRFRGRDAVDAWVKSRTDAQPADGTRWGARPAGAAQHPIAGEDPATATQQLGVPGPWHERLPHFRLEFTPSNGDEQQTEYLIPREHGPEAIRAVSQLDLSDALQVFEMRTIAADDLWISPCGGRATTALHFTWVNDDARVADAVRTVEAAIAGFDPRPHWGKVFAIDAATVRGRYPRLADFRELAARHDPDRKFGNEFLDTYVY